MVALERTLTRAANLAALARFALTRVQPLAQSLRMVRAVYGHRFGLLEATPARHLRVRPHNCWYPLHLPRHTGFDLVLEVLQKRVYEPRAALVAPPRVVVDCGANVGVSCLYFADRFPHATVHAFEPSRRNVAAIRANTEVFPGRVVVNHAGVSDRGGRGMLLLADNTEFHTLRPEMRTTGAGETEDVDLVRLEDYLAQRRIGRIDLLKLDVEGAELDALEGLGPRIGDVGRIVGELHLMAVDEARFRAFLARAGFRLELWSRPAPHVAMFEAVPN